MNIAILGGGYAGLTAAYDLQKKGHEVELFERNTELGGLASGFNPGNWEWPLERAYHHIFASDSDIIRFAEEIKFDKILFYSPQTASLYKVNNNYRIFPLDTPQGFMKFPLLSMLEKIRGAFVLAALRFSPHLQLYEKMTAKDLLVKTMGQHSWDILWKELFRKKFGKYAENILSSFFWARISKRTKKLGYMKGGFQSFTDHLERVVTEAGVKIRKGCPVDSIDMEGERFVIKYNNTDRVFDVVISTLPTPVTAKVTEKIFPASYTNSLRSLEYLNALVLVLETKTPILDSAYWLNVSDPEIPMMFVGQHTNFISAKHYNDNQLAYIGYYLDNDNELMKKSKEELLDFLLPYLKKISGKSDFGIINTYLWKAPFAQPIFDRKFLKNKPDFRTPINNFYITNLDMTYPYDRGTNYAVALGRKVAEMI